MSAHLNPHRPSPRTDSLSEPFFDALSRGSLLVQRCQACAAMHLGQRRCSRCGGADLEWVPASGLGMLYSFAIVHAQYNPAFADVLPYNIAIVELDEGPQIYANVIEAPREELKIGMRLQVRYSPLASGVTVPLFAPAAGAPAHDENKKVATA
jgi:uncharacterized OB-fold protein